MTSNGPVTNVQGTVMNASEVKLFKQHWNAQNGLQGQSALTGLGLSPFPDMTDGYIDLRGLSISQFIRNVNTRRIDLSCSTLDGFGQFGMCNFEQARFRDASLQTNLGSSFTSCDFHSAKMSGVVLRGRFVDCDFSSANLSSAIANQVQFINCVFANANLTKANLLHCLFEDCIFDNCKFRRGSLAFSKLLRSTIPSESLMDTMMEGTISA
jgi:fluoroquinolone resistance protein